MKKIIFVFCMVLLLFVQPIFAVPDEQYVADTFRFILGIHGETLFQAMMGDADGKTLILKNISDDGEITLGYNNYSTEPHVEQLNQFDYMTGTIITNGEIMGYKDSMFIDLKLKGGKIKSFWLKITKNEKDADNPVIKLKIDGKVYKNVKKVFKLLEPQIEN